jgi:hypothetical protein
LIVIAAIVTTIVLVLKNKDDDNKEEDLAILLKDSELKKPNNKINAEFELVKMGNGLKGMLISDPYADNLIFNLL